MELFKAIREALRAGKAVYIAPPTPGIGLTSVGVTPYPMEDAAHFENVAQVLIESQHGDEALGRAVRLAAERCGPKTAAVASAAPAPAPEKRRMQQFFFGGK